MSRQTQSSWVGLGSKAGLESRLLTEAPSFCVQRTLRKKLMLISLGRQLGSVTALIWGGSDASLTLQLCGRETRGARGGGVAGEHAGFTCRPATAKCSPWECGPSELHVGFRAPLEHLAWSSNPGNPEPGRVSPHFLTPSLSLAGSPDGTPCFTSLITPSWGEGRGGENAGCF